MRLVNSLLVMIMMFPAWSLGNSRVDCNQLFRKRPASLNPPLSQARSFEELISALDNLNSRSNKSLNWAASPFLKRKLLKSEELSQYLAGKINQDRLKELVVERITQAFGQELSIKEFTGLLRAVKKSKLIDILPASFLKGNSFVEHKMVDGEKLLALDEKHLRAEIFQDLLNFSRQATSYGEYLNLIDGIKYSDYNLIELDQLLQPMTKLGTEFGEIQSLIDSIKNSLKNGRLHQNRFVGDNLSETFELYYQREDSLEFISLLSHIKTGHPFVVAMNRLAKVDYDISEQIEALAESLFAINQGLGKKEIDQIFKKLKRKGYVSQAKVINEIVALKPHLEGSAKLKNLDNYDRSLNVISIKDQCDSGSCWVHAPVEKYEIELSARLGQAVELSTDYLYYRYLNDEFKRVLTTNNPSLAEVREGGFSSMVPRLIEEYGLMPKLDDNDINFLSQTNFSQLEEKLQLIYEEFNIELYNFSSPKEAKRVYGDKIDALMNEYYRIPKKISFEFNGRKYNPRTFSREYFSDFMHTDYVQVKPLGSVKEIRSIKKEFRFPDGKLEVIKHPIELKSFGEINSIVRESLDEGKAVPVSFIWPTGWSFNQFGENINYIDSQTGRARAPADFESITPLIFNQGAPHAVLIVGYELDEAGKICTYKVLNSWGKNSGENGFYHVEKNFFKHFFMSLDLNVKTGLASMSKQLPRYSWTKLKRIE
jgi:bleomycin hydrolase